MEELSMKRHTPESIEKIRLFQKGRKKNPESIAKTILGKTKKWQNLSYMGKHKRIWKMYGIANKCESLECNKKCLHFEWANISGEYKEDRNDWQMLCCSCHKLHDLYRGDYAKQNN